MKSLVFDSSALICYLDGEERAEKVAVIFEDILEKEYSAFLCVVNLGEIYYHFLRTGGENSARTALSSIKSLPVQFADADFELTLAAATIKAFNKLSYADCFAAALAKMKKAQLITIDKEFSQVEKEIKILWI